MKMSSAESASVRTSVHCLSAGGLAASVLIGIVGAWTILITPGLLAVVAVQGALSDQQLGYVAAWEINAMAVTIGLSTFLLPRWDWRLCVAVGLAFIIAGNVATAFSAGYAAITLTRTIAGAGEGIAVGFAFAAFGRAENPDRAFSIYLVTGALAGAIALLYLPSWQESVGTRTLFLANGALGVLTLGGLFWFPHGRVAADDPRATALCNRRLAFLALIGVFFYFGAISAMWSYAERIGQASGLDAHQIARGLSYGTFAGMGGAALAGLTPRRLGRIGPLLVSGVVSIISFRLLDGRLTPHIFIIAMVLLLFAWNYAQPLLSGVCSDADPRGRIVCAMGSVQTFGMGFGPAAVAATLGSGNFSLAVWGSCAVLGASLLLVVSAIRTS